MRLYKKQKKRLAGALAICLIGLIGVSIFQPNISKGTEVYFFDIGQGNSELVITSNGQTILIDGGPDHSILSLLGEALPLGHRSIDLMVLTHPHQDHVAGLIAVMDRYEVKRALITGVLHTTESYRHFLEKLSEKNIPVEYIGGYRRYNFDGGIKFEVLYPSKNLVGKSVKNLNDTSIVSRLQIGEVAVLFTGDVEREAEAELLKSDLDLTADVMTSPHQGSKTSSTEKLLRAVNPKEVVISSGKNNKFGHPHKQVLDRYRELGISWHRTDQEGTVVLRSDGISYTLGAKDLKFSLLSAMIREIQGYINFK